MSVNLDDKTKLVALAHLKNGKKPKEVAEKLDISYSQALRLSKDLVEAERKDAVLELFKLPKATLDMLLDSVRDNMALPADLLSTEAIEGELENLKKGVEGLEMLDTKFQDAASALADQIKLMALTSSQPDTVLMLSNALANLQNSFFAKGNSIQVNNINASGFEEFLRD